MRTECGILALRGRSLSPAAEAFIGFFRAAEAAMARRDVLDRPTTGRTTTASGATRARARSPPNPGFAVWAMPALTLRRR
jgi:hypothetical protein